MECFIAFIALVLLFTVTVVAAAIAQSRADKRNQAYYQLAQRHGGVCQPAGWFRAGNVRFRYGTTHAVLYTYTGGAGGPATLLQLEWPDSRIQLEVFQHLATQANPLLRETADVRVGAESFDEMFAVRAADPREARIWLSEGVRWQIERLRLFSAPQSLHVSLLHGRLIVRKQGRLRRFDELEEFVRLVLELYDQAMLTRSVGIEFVDDGSVQPIREAICQVCGENIASEMVFCRRCKTPHHHDCWQYYGACSTYGCRETVYVTPRVAASADESTGRPNRPR